jgi:hypothetical protein
MQLQIMAARVLGELPPAETEVATMNGVPATITNDGTAE